MRTLALACCAALLATAAQAQPSSIVGAWTFSTAPYGETACTISGRAAITPRPARGRYDVRTEVVQHCAVNEDVVTEQACEAIEAQGRLEIDCRVVRGPPADQYLPDNFTLNIRTNELMEGELRSGWRSPALWRRGVGGPVA